MKLNKILQLLVTVSFMLNAAIASSNAQYNYCGTTCLSHQQVVHFDSDVYLQVIMSPTTFAALRNLENNIRQLGPNRGLVACIAGHADSDASDAYNIELSMNRARTMGMRLRNFGLAQGIPVKLSGYGEGLPIANNATDAGKAQNRRVVLQYGYNSGPGAACLTSGVGDVVQTAAPQAAPAPVTGGLSPISKIGLGVLAVGALAAVIDSGDGPVGTTE